MRLSSGCENVWCATVWPSLNARRASCGYASALRPSKKNDARAHSRLSVSRTRAVVPGAGPVVEGEHDLLGREREGVMKVLAADARRRRGVDRQDARGAERFGGAGRWSRG